MQSLAIESGPHTKRRKLDHSQQGGDIEPKRDVPDGAELERVDAENADDVEEDEEGPETATDGLLQEDEDLEDASDPFESHFAAPEGGILSQRLKSLRNNQWSTKKMVLPIDGKVVLSIPEPVDSTASVTSSPISGPENLKLKQKLSGAFIKQQTSFDKLERSIAPFIFNYQDVLFCSRHPGNAESLRRLTCLHMVNHIFKLVNHVAILNSPANKIDRTRDRVIKNNARLAKEVDNTELELRDQGFTRPKVLVILPTRESCVRMIKVITLLCEPEQQENVKRFEDTYVERAVNLSEDKPEDFRELFAGNDDDMFRLGLKFTRKTIKYFSQFYNSDIIFASPLGLRMALEGKEDKKGDYDFLSSIEMVVVDQADALVMQRWEHVEFIFEHLNLQPREAHGCDFSRVRNWYLDNNAKYFRQIITLAAFNTTEINTLFLKESKNWTGKVKISPNYSGAIQGLGLKVKQTFSRLGAPSFDADPDSRFEYFTSAIIPTLTRRIKDTSGVVIFIPSYFDFPRIRNYFATSPNTSGLSFASISEYTPVRDVARARSHFLSGKHSILLYTERAHHFRRYRLQGVKKIIMYGLPDNPIFYKEMVEGYLGRSVQEGKLEPGQGSVRVIFSKWDLLKLERVAGSERVGKMIRDKGDTFDFL